MNKEQYERIKSQSIPLKVMQMSLFEDLKEVDRVCKKLGCTYFLAYGTLLGAVRHEGFIPWDDDIDIWMFRKDFEKFVAHAQEEFNDNYFLQNPLTDKHYDIPQQAAKVRNRTTTLIEDLNKKYHQGGFVDIFPMDYVGDDPVKFHKLKKKCAFIQSLKMRISFKELSGIKKYIRIGLQLIFKLVSMKALYNYLQKNIALVRDNDKSSNPAVTTGLDDLSKEMYTRDMFFPVKTHKFEDYEFMIPNDPDAILKIMYGDYMQIPDESQRIPHGLFYGDKSYKEYE